MGRPLRHGQHRLRLRSLILLVALVPILGMVAMAGVLATEALLTRDTARRAEARVTSLASLAEARIVVVNERTVSGLLVFAAELGFDADQLREFTGTDHRDELSKLRTASDANATLGSILETADRLARLQAVRDAVDAGNSSSSQVRSVYDELTGAIDQAWNEEFGQLVVDLRSGDASGALQDRATALRASFAAQRWGISRAAFAIDLSLESPADPATQIRLIGARGHYRAAVGALEEVLGPAASEVWDEHLTDPGVQRFLASLNEVEDHLITGTSALAMEAPDAFQESFADANIWADSLGDLVRAAAHDLTDEGIRQGNDATNSLQLRVAIAGVFILLSLAGAALLTASVTRPVRRLEDAATQIQEGRFDLEPIETTGPRELADTASAFNEMTSTLANVEAYATTLADEPEDPLLDHPIPGRTGQALQVALNRLRSSIRQAEKRREELVVAATHDALTGLGNRAAAMMMITRDLAAVDRSDSEVTALFIDLDEFKAINDRYGHAVGDDALRLVADALRATTRQADVIARIGGDEFLVAGTVVGGLEEVESLAGRIRHAIGSTRLGTPDGPVPLHCSIGMALSRPSDDVDSLVQRADSAMYDAKRQGRDHIAWAGGNEPLRPSASS